MYKLNYKNIAILTLVVAAIIIFYSQPSRVVEFFYPDYFSEHAKPRDPFVFTIVLLGIILGVLGILTEKKKK